MKNSLKQALAQPIICRSSGAEKPKYSSASRTGTLRVSVWTMSTGPPPSNSSAAIAAAWREVISFTRDRSSRRTASRITEMSWS
jgi:hypothetical protein